jgi:cell division protein FtsZ
MRNGGVAILGNATAEGENRAQKAIEEAMNSPLLNDNDIRGAKWILININSAEGEHEFTMDEVEVIQNYLLSQAGDNTDVILGMGYDNTLGNRIGITLIATGFEHKDPFARPMPKKEEPKKEEKIVMILGQVEEKIKEDKKKDTAPVLPVATAAEKPVVKLEDRLAPTLIEELPMIETPVFDITDMKEHEAPVIHWELSKDLFTDKPEEKIMISTNADHISRSAAVDKMWMTEKNENIFSDKQLKPVNPIAKKESVELNHNIKDSTSPVPAASGGYLARPSNIYTETKVEVFTSMPSAEEPIPLPHVVSKEEQELLDLQMQLVERDNIPAAGMPMAHQIQAPLSTEVEDSALQDETDEQKRRAAERLHKLRNLSFNVNAADPNNEFETVPAYIRRNMELYNNNTQVENFYSNYEVKTDDKNQTHISTINTFLDGKKPD